MHILQPSTNHLYLSRVGAPHLNGAIPGTRTGAEAPVPVDSVQQVLYGLADFHCCHLWLGNTWQYMAVGQNLVPLVNIQIAGKWMFIPLKIVLIGIDS